MPTQISINYLVVSSDLPFCLACIAVRYMVDSDSTYFVTTTATTATTATTGDDFWQFREYAREKQIKLVSAEYFIGYLHDSSPDLADQ